VTDLGEKFRSDRVFFADLDGDGASDLIVIDASDNSTRAPQIKIYMNQSGNSYADPITLALPEGVTYNDLDRIDFADILGNGTQCLVYTQTHPVVKMWYYDFCNGTKPYLVCYKTNNMGVETQISHKSSVHYYLEDESNGNPWIVCAPFPVQLVSTVTSYDAISQNTLTSSSRYRHSYYDGVEREFRGFGYSEQQDTTTFNEAGTEFSIDSPPSLIKTWYHLGADDQDSLSQQFATEYYAGDIQATQLSDSVVLDIDGTPIDASTSDSDQAELYREAQMALKGTTLHSEIYGLDGSARSSNPYSVSEVNATVQILQPKDDNQYAVVLVLPREQLSYVYERNPADPIYSYSADLEFDAYGHVLQSCGITYPRRTPTVSGLNVIYQEQQKLRLTCALSAVDNLTSATSIDATLSSDSVYLLGIPIEMQAYFIAPESSDGSITLANKLGYTAGSNDSLITYSTLQTALQTTYTAGAGFSFNDSDITTLAELGKWMQNFYMYPTTDTPASVAQADDGIYSPSVNTSETVITPFALSRVGSRGLLLDWYGDSVAYDKASIDANYSQFFQDMSWGDSDQAMSNANYLSKNEGNYWWIRSGHLIYQPGTMYFSPVRAYDVLDVMQTQATYDDYSLFMVTYTDAFGNTQTVEEIDYQNLLPTRLLDINGNTTEVLVDASGVVFAASTYGSETRFLKNTAETAPNDLDSYYHALVGFDTLANYSVGIYDDTGMEVQQQITDLINQPRTYIQNASAYFFYNKFAWCGQITKAELAGLTPSSGNTAPDVDSLWDNLVAQGYIGYTGAILSATRALSVDDLVLDTENQPYAASLVALFASIPAGTQPVHVAAIAAMQFPRIFPEDLRDITDADGNTISSDNWTTLWNDMVSQGYIDSTGLIALSTWNITSAANLTLDSADMTYQQSLFDYLQGLSQMIISLEYNDGFGRAVQSKALIEDGQDCLLYNPSAAPDAVITSNSTDNAITPRWQTDGYMVYNNKGQVAKKYDPYFINTYLYIDYQNFDQSSDSTVQDLVSNVVMIYDPLGRTPYVISHKGFLTKADWTPWEACAYDGNDCFIDSPYFQDNVIEPSTEATYYNDELTDTDRAILADPVLYRTEGNQLSAQGLAYFKALQHAWTPTVTVHDNRGKVLVAVALDNHQFTADDFQSVVGDNAAALYTLLQQQNYLDSYGYLGSALTIPPLVLMNTGAGATTTLENEAVLVGFNRLVLNVLLSNAIANAPVLQADLEEGLQEGVGTFYSLYPFLNADIETFYTLLQTKGYLDANGDVQTSVLPIPALDFSNTAFSGDEDAVLTLILNLWSTGLRELPTVNCYDNQGRGISITDARFVSNNLAAYETLLFGQS
jgi:hypothetical protein